MGRGRGDERYDIQVVCGNGGSRMGGDLACDRASPLFYDEGLRSGADLGLPASL